MRRGQVDDWVDIVAGVLVLLLGFALFSYTVRDLRTSDLDTMAFQDSFDRTLITFLSSPVRPLTIVGDSTTTLQYTTLANKGYTYGDLLFLASVDTSRSSLYYSLFAYHLRHDVLALSPSSFRTPTEWQLNTTSQPPLIVNSLEGQSILPHAITSLEGFSSVVALYYPLTSESFPLYLYSHYGRVTYLAP